MNENFDEVAEVFRENAARIEEEKSHTKTEDLSPEEKLERWKNLAPHQFDSLSGDDRTALIIEYNDLIDQVKEKGLSVEDRVVDEDDFKRRLRMKDGPSLERLREVLGKPKDIK